MRHILALLLLTTPLAAQSAPRYGDLTRDGSITAADTLALRALLTGDSSLVDSTYRVRPDTLAIVANVWPANRPGLGERTDSMPPGWQRPRWKAQVTRDDLRAIERWMRGDTANTAVNALVPAWRLSGGVNLARGDVLYLGDKVRAMVGPGTYTVLAVRRYPDSTLRASGQPWNVQGNGIGYLTPFWVGLSNGSAPGAWAFGASASEPPPTARPSWNFEVASLDHAKGDGLMPPGPGYPGCAALPGRTLGDTVRLWTNPNTGGTYTTQFAVGGASSGQVGGATEQRRFTVVAQSRRAIALVDSLTLDLMLQLGTNWTIDTVRALTFNYIRGVEDSSFTETRAPILPTSSVDVSTGRILRPGQPVYVFISWFPMAFGRPAAAQLGRTVRLRAGCDSVAAVSFSQRVTSIAQVRALDLGATYWHEIGHVVTALLRNSGNYAAGLDEGLANLNGFRQLTRTTPLARAWTVTPAQQTTLAGTGNILLAGASNGCNGVWADFIRNTNGTGLEYAQACSILLNLAATASERRGIGADAIWREFARGASITSWDSLVARTWGIPLRDAYPQLLASVLTQGRRALYQGAPWQVPFRVTVSDTTPTATVSAGQTVKTRADSTAPGLHLRLSGVTDSAVIRIFTRDSTQVATSAQLHNLALVLVRD
jgi:hypothetical protein